MSQENVEIVRQPITVGVSRHRTLLERAALRFPQVIPPLLARASLRLPVRSRLRQAMIRYVFRSGIEAANRGDWEATFMAITSPDYETTVDTDLIGLGFDPVYRGRDGRLRLQYQWLAELGEFRQETEGAIDCGDRLVLLAQMEATGASSGAGFEGEVAYVFTISQGQTIREQVFRSHAEALEAAGLWE
jgi:hypothetical protein